MASKKPTPDPLPTPPTEPDVMLSIIVTSLREVVETIKPAIVDLKKTSVKTSRVLRFAIIGLVLDLALSVGLGAAFWRTESTNGRVTIACQETNELRQAELNLWLPLLANPRPDQTPEQIAQAAQFELTLRAQFALKDCK